LGAQPQGYSPGGDHADRLSACPLFCSVAHLIRDFGSTSPPVSVSALPELSAGRTHNAPSRR
jgi:hypothetical protein